MEIFFHTQQRKSNFLCHWCQREFRHSRKVDQIPGEVHSDLARPTCLFEKCRNFFSVRWKKKFRFSFCDVGNNICNLLTIRYFRYHCGKVSKIDFTVKVYKLSDFWDNLSDLAENSIIQHFSKVISQISTHRKILNIFDTFQKKKKSIFCSSYEK